jgi:hypothetical protein
MRTDLTKEACLSIWKKHKEAIEETIKNKSKDCKCTFNFNGGKTHTWTNESRLEYVNKMIERIKNCEEYV